MITLITKKRLQELERCQRIVARLSLVYRWFAGWKDLDILFDYLYKDTYFGGIRDARKRYAESRGTDEYGKRRAD